MSEEVILLTVLVAENFEPYRESLVALLRLEEVNVLEAANPQEALQFLEDVHIDLVVTDLRLTDDSDKKDASGLEVYRTADEKCIPAILVSSSSVELSGICFVNKSLGWKALWKKIQELTSPIAE